MFSKSENKSSTVQVMGNDGKIEVVVADPRREEQSVPQKAGEEKSASDEPSSKGVVEETSGVSKAEEENTQSLEIDRNSWLVDAPYNPSKEWRELFVQRWSCGLSRSYPRVHEFFWDLSGWHWKRKFVTAAVPALLWGFFLSLKVLGTGFKLLGGKDSAKMFDVADNPFAGVCLGILATILVQSSSTSTSLIVTAVASGELSVKIAVAMVMGANIGTTITNTLVAFLHSREQKDFGRAIAGATVHDLFNFLNVAVLLPIHMLSNPFVWITAAMTVNVKDCQGDCEGMWNPVSASVKPVAGLVAKIDKDILKAIASDACNQMVNGTQEIDCEAPLLKSGLLFEMGLSDAAAGSLSVGFSVIALCACLYSVVRSLHFLIRGKMTRKLQKALKYNDYMTMLVGCGFTIAVQSSSITTSTLTPLVAEGVITLEEMYPLTLGANVGTCITGLMAAMVATSNAKQALQTALSHLLFNVLGIMIWYPTPCLRKLPIKGAQYLGKKAQESKVIPLLYTAGAFVVLPLAGWGISSAVSPGGASNATAS